MDSFRAAVRLRPLTYKENVKGEVGVVLIDPSKKQVVFDDQRSFTFDNVYGDDASQESIYYDLVQPLVGKVVDGYNACVMAYGQTGTGKTYTMGTDIKKGVSKPEDQGIVFRTLDEVFKTCMNERIELSFVEVHKEDIYDLLSDKRCKLHLFDFQPHGLTKLVVKTVEEAKSTVEKGFTNRRVAATAANADSSRSHAVFTVHITTSSSEGERTSKLYLVDLAGSESVTDIHGDRRREGLMINKGLLQLTNVISALTSTNRDHVPYRNSTLTSILKDTLTPRNIVRLIACISPLESDANVTLSTLKFATRVSSLKCNPEAGQVIKQKVQTPFRVPFTPLKINNTIATPGRRNDFRRPQLPPLNLTVDSPQPTSKLPKWTPYGSGSIKRPLYSSTPATSSVMPPPISVTPVQRRVKHAKRQCSTDSDWNDANISTSTTVDGYSSIRSGVQMEIEKNLDKETSPHVLAGFTEDRLRTIIADVVRQQISATFSQSEYSRQNLFQDDIGPSPPKMPRRSLRLSLASAKAESSTSSIEATIDGTVIATSSPNIQQNTASCGSPDLGSEVDASPHDASVSPHRQPTLPVSELDFYFGNTETHNKEPLCRPVSPKRAPKKQPDEVLAANVPVSRSVRISTRLSVAPLSYNEPFKLERAVRRSARISIVPPVCQTSDTGSNTHRTVRRSTRLSVAPAANTSKSSRSKRQMQHSSHLSVEDDSIADETQFSGDAQQQHNNVILNILRAGNARKLQSLPTIGPKTATIICNHRLLHGALERLEDLKNVRGLSSGFPKRFFWANSVTIEDEN